MANPFLETLDQVIDYSTDRLPSLSHLELLLTFLSDEESKVIAQRRGLQKALVLHYEACIGDESRLATRVICVEMLGHMVTIMKCRDELFDEIGLVKALAFFSDAAAEVRLEACYLFQKLTPFPFAKDAMLQDRTVMETLTTVLLHDANEDVAMAAVPVLSTLCQFDPIMEPETVTKLVQLIAMHTPRVENNTRVSVHLVRSILKLLWNVSCDGAEKEIAISCATVDTVVPLLGSSDLEIQRLAAGMLSAISVAEKGKMAIITAPNAVELLAVVVLDRHAHKDLRDNCVLTIRSMCEAGEGLTAMGMRLLSESDIFNEILSRMEASKIIATMLETDRQREALEALVLLVKTGLGRKAAWNILDIIPKLHKISQTASDQRVRGLTSRCLEALCLDNHMAQAELDKLPVLATGSNDVFGTGKVTLLGPETAILLVCYQNDFCQKAGALQGHVNDSMEESQMMSNTVDLKEKARRKGAAFHYVNFHSSPELASTDSGNGFLKMVVAENAFVKDTWGTQVTHELQPEPEDTVYNMHSLSPFEDTDLDQKLKELSVQNVVVCGFMTDGAVEKTLRDAYERGYTTYFLTDCAAASSSMQENYIETVLPAFCEALTRNQLLAFMPSALGQ